MPQAWQVREAQRAEKLKELKRLAYGQEESLNDEHFSLKLALIILLYLDRRKHPRKPLPLKLASESKTANVFFVHVVVEELITFSRSDEELRYMLSEFVQCHLVPDALREFRSDLRNQEIMKPVLIYRTQRPDEEIPYPD